ncbi:MAG: hypothetical protein ACRCXL_15530 [Dermatophilaceae bacterium]
MSHQLELRLIDAAFPTGEIPLSDLSAIAASLQELHLRIARLSVDSERRGRPNDTLAQISQMRLTGVSEGSTRLLISRGEPDTLDVEPAEIADLDAKFDDVIRGIADDARPGWVTDPVAESAADLVKALKAAAPSVEARVAGSPVVHIFSDRIHRETWTAREAQPTREADLSGTLEAVDLRSGRFRLVDDIGNRVALEQIPRPLHIAPLIGRRVHVSGEASLDSSGRVRSVTKPLIADDPLPDAWLRHEPADFTAELAKPGPQPDGGIELTDEEYAGFVNFLKT